MHHWKWPFITGCAVCFMQVELLWISLWWFCSSYHYSSAKSNFPYLNAIVPFQWTPALSHMLTELDRETLVDLIGWQKMIIMKSFFFTVTPKNHMVLHLTVGDKTSVEKKMTKKKKMTKNIHRNIVIVWLRCSKYVWDTLEKFALYLSKVWDVHFYLLHFYFTIYLFVFCFFYNSDCMAVSRLLLSRCNH